MVPLITAPVTGSNPESFKVADAPGVTNLATDKKAGPGEEWRRQIGRGRWVAKVSGENRRSGENKGTNGCQVKISIHKVFLLGANTAAKYSYLLTSSMTS
jgi:hypothetical protein